eukprot:CAMPEP_0184500452 /NCGR_PEP_ID=MMETSP0113_2-20130426/44844_1 /TAXON_ID=91329 /ORGANISM="Norrisiella sphaerica, Strain BC52" /LENGTH=51 /DNA_ID=CAMNT_0026888829 /DNA_START=245 /DNA_END=400 /DNA_ORIENTATION=-
MMLMFISVMVMLLLLLTNDDDGANNDKANSALKVLKCAAPSLYVNAVGSNI